MKNVFAHYFTWFSRKDLSGLWGHWNWDGPGVRHDPDRIIDGREDVAAIDTPLIGIYDSSLPWIHRYHLDLAGAAGIDAFCVDWYGPDAAAGMRDNVVNENFLKMLTAASTHRVKLCVCYEEKVLHNCDAIDRGKAHQAYITERFFTSPGYWHVDNRPVVVIWGNNRLASGDWERILAGFKPYNPWLIYSHHDHNPEYAGICHGFYPWIPLGDLNAQRRYLEEYYATALDYVKKGLSTTLGGGVWPGFNDSGVWGWGAGPRIIEDPDDSLYDLTWEFVLAHQPEWVSVATWNDWNEGSNIEPGRETGLKYLAKTAIHVGAYKNQARDREATKDIIAVIDRYVEETVKNGAGSASQGLL